MAAHLRALALSLLFPSLLPAAHADAPRVPLNNLDSSVTLYVYPPRNRIDWSTPGNALRTVMGSLISAAFTDDSAIEFLSDFGDRGDISSSYKSSMGHTLGHIRCRLPGGALFERWTSFSGQEYREEDKRLLFREKHGYGSMFYNYIDGHIISGEENVKRITFYKGKKENGERVRPLYLQVEVEPKRCAELKQMNEFFESFRYKPGTPLEQLRARGELGNLHFTNQMDPWDGYLARKRGELVPVGGGCAPYGAALLKAAGRYLPVFEENFRTPVTVSEKLIGHQWNKDGTVRRVSIHDILHTPLGTRWDWSHEGYTNRFVSMYDPQKIWDFTRAVIHCLDTAQCSQAAAAFLRPQAGKVAPGTTQVFEQTYQREIGTRADENPNHVVTEHVKQPVRGFVWRLNRAR